MKNKRKKKCLKILPKGIGQMYKNKTFLIIMKKKRNKKKKHYTFNKLRNKLWNFPFKNQNKV